jgi:4-nitrotryptophan synthase
MFTASDLCNVDLVAFPFDMYAYLREKSPILWSEEMGGWAVLSHGLCEEVLNDPRCSANRMGPILDLKFGGHGLKKGSTYDEFVSSIMMYVDGDLHDRLRRSMYDAFTAEATRHYYRVMDRLAADRVRSIVPGEEFDVIEKVARELPAQVAMHVFGLPAQDRSFVVERVDKLMTFWSGAEGQPIPIGELLQYLQELRTYVEGVLEGSREIEPDTVLAYLLASESLVKYASPNEIVHQLVLVLMALFAPTTPGTLASGVLAFAKHPDQIPVFSEYPNADEIFRFNASNVYTPRFVLEDMMLGEVRIEAGQVVYAYLAAANWDPGIFPEPRAFNLKRQNSSRHLSLGFGPHSCLAAPIVRHEVRCFFNELLKDCGEIEIVGTPEWRGLEFRRLVSLYAKVVRAA